MTNSAIKLRNIDRIEDECEQLITEINQHLSLNVSATNVESLKTTRTAVTRSKRAVASKRISERPKFLTCHQKVVRLNTDCRKPSTNLDDVLRVSVSRHLCDKITKINQQLLEEDGGVGNDDVSATTTRLKSLRLDPVEIKPALTMRTAYNINLVEGRAPKRKTQNVAVYEHVHESSTERAESRCSQNDVLSPARSPIPGDDEVRDPPVEVMNEQVRTVIDMRACLFGNLKDSPRTDRRKEKISNHKKLWNKVKKGRSYSATKRRTFVYIVTRRRHRGSEDSFAERGQKDIAKSDSDENRTTAEYHTNDEGKNNPDSVHSTEDGGLDEEYHSGKTHEMHADNLVGNHQEVDKSDTLNNASATMKDNVDAIKRDDANGMRQPAITDTKIEDRYARPTNEKPEIETASRKVGDKELWRAETLSSPEIRPECTVNESSKHARKTGKIQNPSVMLTRERGKLRRQITTTIRPPPIISEGDEEFRKRRTNNAAPALSSYASVIYQRLLDDVSRRESMMSSLNVDTVKDRIDENEARINVLIDVIKTSYERTSDRLNIDGDFGSLPRNVSHRSDASPGRKSSSNSTSTSCSLSIGEVRNANAESSLSPGEIRAGCCISLSSSDFTVSSTNDSAMEPLEVEHGELTVPGSPFDGIRKKVTWRSKDCLIHNLKCT